MGSVTEEDDLAMATYLLKTEPSDYCFADLQKAGTCRWDGVSNAAALIAMRSMRKGDEVLVYHTGDEKAVVGLAKVTSDPFEDPEQPGKTAKGEPKFAVVTLAPVAAAKSRVTLAAIKADPRFKEFPLVTQGRLSVMAVGKTLDRLLRKMAGLPG
jgi:predicted RNA-binding protein with PUA-like domain